MLSRSWVSAASAARAASWLRKQLEGAKGWQASLVHLLDATLWPVAVVEKVYAAEGAGFRLAELVPVPDRLLDFSKGTLRIRKTSPEGMVLTESETAEEARYIVHRGHLLSIADHRGGPLRSLVWWWLLSTMDREWWTRFLDRYGSPFLVGKFESGDDASRSILERAFSYATKIGGLVVSRETDVEIQQAISGAAGDAFKAFLEVAQREKSKLVIGQTLSGDTQAQGLGTGATGLHGEVRDDIRQFDARQLAQTLATQLAAPLLRLNGVAHELDLAWGAGAIAAASATTGALLAALSHTIC